MALKDIQIPKAEVQVGSGGSFAVRGLSTSDIEHLVRTHGGELRGLFTEFMSGKLDEMMKGDMAPVLTNLVGRVPGVVQDIIALAADADAEDKAIIGKLSAGVQVDALIKVASLTLSTEGNLGNAQGAVMKVLELVNLGVAEAMLEKAAS